MREITIPLNELLDLTFAAEDHGYDGEIFYSFIFNHISPLIDEEIEEFANMFLTKEMKDKGYSEEDYEDVKEILLELRRQYA